MPARAGDLRPGWFTYLAIGLAAYAVIELVEGVGLWLGRRWGEYFAMVATSVFLPYEIYDLTVKITWLRLGALLINLLLVVYLAWTKRLFGPRGGKAAHQARLRSESVIEVEQAALAAALRPAAVMCAAVMDAPGPRFGGNLSGPVSPAVPSSAVDPAFVVDRGSHSCHNTP